MAVDTMHVAIVGAGVVLALGAAGLVRAGIVTPLVRGMGYLMMSWFRSRWAVPVVMGIALFEFAILWIWLEAPPHIHAPFVHFWKPMVLFAIAGLSYWLWLKGEFEFSVSPVPITLNVITIVSGIGALIMLVMGLYALL